MNWTQSMHLRGVLRILWIMIIHIYNSHCLGNLISAYHAIEEEHSLDTTEFISTTMNAIIDDNDQMTRTTDKKITENFKNDILDNHSLSSCQSNIDINDNINIWGYNNNPNSNHSNTPSPTITPNYDIKILEENAFPILSYINHTTTYQQVFNPSWIPQSDTVSQTGIVVQVQNCSLIPGDCTYCNSTSDGIVFTPCDAETGVCQYVAAPSGPVPSVPHQNESIQSIESIENDINALITKQTHIWQNPSIFYWQNLYYMFVNAETKSSGSNQPNEYVELYTAYDPTNISETYTNWTNVQNAFSKKGRITGPASLLPMNLSEPNAKHYLFFGGEGHISVTNSCDIKQWYNIDFNPWLSPRTNYFDKDGVETGPAPIKLYDGNYLMLYNGYTITNISGHEHDLFLNITNHAVIPHKIKHYQIGWVILDASNPTKILQRSDKPLLTATFDYEIGNAPYTCTQHSSVYAKSIIKLQGSSNSTTESFRIYFSAADTSVGTATISVSYASSDDATKEWFEVAVIVSVGCAIFVLAMFLVIWCKNHDQSSVLDLTTEPEFISIASAHQSSFKDISGTNHNGTPYVIGSLDRKVTVHSSAHIPRKKHSKHRGKYETNDDENNDPNHIHVHTTECYEENSNENCRYLHQDENAQNGLNTSLQSNISSSSCSSSSSSSSSSSTSTSRATGNSPISSSSTSYCSHCHGKFHETVQEKEISKSETMRLSQISFRINETLEKDSPSSTHNNTHHTITIDGYNPNKTKFSFTNKTLGQRLIQKN